MDLELIEDGTRLYVRTSYGHPVVAALKSLRATPEYRDGKFYAWLLGVSKKEAVQKAIAQCESKVPEKAPEDPATIKVLGKARYKKRLYYIRWIGMTRSGAYKAHLVSLDGKLSFWVKAAQPFERDVVTGDGDVARPVKMFATSRILADIQRFVTEVKMAPRHDEPAVRAANLAPRQGGCPDCAHLGFLCGECSAALYGDG